MNRVLVVLAFAVFTIPAIASADCGNRNDCCQPTCCQQTCCKTSCQVCYKTKTRLRLVRTCEQRSYTDRCGCCRTRNVSRLKLVRECVQVPVCKCTRTCQRVCKPCCKPCGCCNTGCGSKGILARLGNRCCR